MEIEKFYKLEEEFQDLKTNLIQNLPNKLGGWNDKEHFSFRLERNVIYVLNTFKWIEYNQKWVNYLIIDIDNNNLDTTYNKCLDLGFEPSFGCETDKGCHIFFKLENIVKYEWEKTISFVRDIKECLTHYLGGDKNGSHRLNGIWRNPLKHKFIYSYVDYSLNDFKELLNQYRNQQKPQKKQFKNHIRNIKIYSKRYKYQDGNRNEFLWYMGMIWSRNKDYSFNEILEYIKYSNENESKKNNVKKINNIKELEKISRSIKKYNDKGLNNVKKLFDNGVMGFDKIKNLSFEDYEKEKKKRQVLAASRTNQIIENDKEKEMTRVEHCKRLNKKTEEKNRKKVFNILSGLFNEDYKKKNGSWNSVKISKDLNMNVKTVRKYVKEYEEKN